MLVIIPISAGEGSLSSCFTQNVILIGRQVFPPLLVHLVTNGEQSGQLAAMLERAAALLEQESERRITWFAALVQPALIVAMGAIVLVLVLAIMLPIVSMNQLIR